MERQAEEDANAQAEAVAAEETQNALDRAEEKTFSNCEPEEDSESEPGLLIQSNEPEDCHGSPRVILGDAPNTRNASSDSG